MDATTKAAIVAKATADQKAGISWSTGAKDYETMPERIAYRNAWLESIRANGIPAQFVR